MKSSNNYSLDLLIWKCSYAFTDIYKRKATCWFKNKNHYSKFLKYLFERFDKESVEYCSKKSLANRTRRVLRRWPIDKMEYPALIYLLILHYEMIIDLILDPGCTDSFLFKQIISSFSATPASS